MEHGGDIFLSGTVLLAAALAFVLLFRRLGLGELAHQGREEPPAEGRIIASAEVG